MKPSEPSVIKYIVADLGDVWLQKLTPEQVRRFYTRIGKKGGTSEKGLSSKTIHEIHGVLHLALKNAMRWGYVSRNVCDLVEPPRIVSREVTPLTLEQAQALLKSVRERRLEVLLTMAVVTQVCGVVNCWPYVGQISLLSVGLFSCFIQLGLYSYLLPSM